ncbi:hypothetical protein [Azohydromonas lata]|uniref:Lipoprotein n=1 Tax=Azohydromonas lata TaxID=45677 RepID=A0ABU5IQ13_9BURK|nr:hypothetical protein [Azohydromonas lata]MDZ5460959.1 hypothetical protein [Azohydromonas lata]
MRFLALIPLVAAACACTPAAIQSQPPAPGKIQAAPTRPSANVDDASATAGSSLERSSQSYDSGNSGRDAARRPAAGGTSDGIAGDVAASAPAGAQPALQGGTPASGIPKAPDQPPRSVR